MDIDNKTKKKFEKRIWEIIPGLLSWILITSPIWGGVFFPIETAYFVLIFNSYWLYKSISGMIFFLIGYFRIREGENTDWISKLERLENKPNGINDLKKDIQRMKVTTFSKDGLKNQYLKRFPKIIQRIIFKLEKRNAINYLKAELKKLQGFDKDDLKPSQLHHIVIIPFWKEGQVVLRRSLDKLASQKFPTNQISVVLGAEARYPPAFNLAKKLQKQYEDVFENFWVNNHELTKEEIIGKASNMASCGKMVQEKIKELKWDKSNVTVTSCDSDTQFDERYFAYFSYLYVLDKNRKYHYYAAPMVYYANIWRVPFYSRVANTLFTVNNIATAVRTDKYIQVSSYSFSWSLLEDIDFWSVDIIPEDFHMFFKGLFVHGDKVKTEPIYLKNLSDAAESVGHKGTVVNQYEQVKRWAWGVSDDGWMIRQFLNSGKKSLYMFYRVFHTIFDHLTWSIVSFILLFGANIPTMINDDFSQTVFGQKLPKVASFMMTLTTIAFVLTIAVDFFLKPRRKEKVSIFKRILEQFQWIFFPISGFIFGAIPGLDAQTRLLFGKYMEYRLTEKH